MHGMHGLHAMQWYMRVPPIGSDVPGAAYCRLSQIQIQIAVAVFFKYLL